MFLFECVDPMQRDRLAYQRKTALQLRLNVLSQGVLPFSQLRLDTSKPLLHFQTKRLHPHFVAPPRNLIVQAYL
jgi:hypothetical protein